MFLGVLLKEGSHFQLLFIKLLENSMYFCMACNGVLTPPPVLKFFNPPSPQTFYSPPPTGNGCFCIFHT